MIKTTSALSAKTEFEIECDVCGSISTKEISKTSIDADQKLSSAEAALCNTCKPKFVKWVREKYPKDCWCKHIKEYKEAQSKSEVS